MEQERVKSRSGLELKLGKGGMADIEFLVQAIQLKTGGKKVSLRVPNTFEVLRAIRKNAILSRSKAGILQSNYVTLRTLEMLIRLNSPSKAVELPQDKIQMKALSSAMEERSSHELKSRLAGIRSENRDLFLKTLTSYEK